jgi:transketolase
MKSSILSVKTIKILAMAAISQAKSGHGGIVLGAAPIMYALFHDHLTVDVTDLNYFNRDRFILSSGHGSALLYATMLVADYHSITIKDLKQFRQLNSKTSGHPENKILPGVEVCTGPLGQGAGMSVGFAIAEQVLNHRYQIAKNQGVIDHYTYVLLGDGDLQEGVTQEAMAIAGKQKLNKLIWLYDSNQIQLDGKATDSTI